MRMKKSLLKKIFQVVLLNNVKSQQYITDHIPISEWLALSLITEMVLVKYITTSIVYHFQNVWNEVQ
jgi:hypothetical protein